MAKLDSRKCLYQFRWQKLRTSLDFGTLTEVETSLSELRKYLGTQWEDDNDYNRYYRVVNLAAAVRMGIQGRLKQGNGDEEQLQAMDKEVGAFLEWTSERYEVIKARGGWPLLQTEVQQVRELLDAFRRDHDSFMRVNKSLQERLSRTKNPENRKELTDYLGLMARVIAAGKK